MLHRRTLRLLRHCRPLTIHPISNSLTRPALATKHSLEKYTTTTCIRSEIRNFHAHAVRRAIKPVALSDIGEGIVECEVIQWFVQPGARVEEFAPLCEVQSDKASVEITSRFSGVIRKLYYEAGDMAKVGKPFIDIDVDGLPEGKSKTSPEPAPSTVPSSTPESIEDSIRGEAGVDISEPIPSIDEVDPKRERNRAIATPAVRHLSKQHGVDITKIDGTGKDGRVLKEDVMRFINNTTSRSSTQEAKPSPESCQSNLSDLTSKPSPSQQETVIPLTNTQLQMFKTMTKSLTIPHFLYSDEVDFSRLSDLRTRLNRILARSTDEGQVVDKLSYLPFIIKAVSMALHRYPIINSRVDVTTDPGKPSIVHRSQHNIGVAMDTPAGLLVPVIRDVAHRTILSVASELRRLQSQANQGKLGPADLTGGTITVSNIGNIGGTYLSPVIVEKQVAILGIGRMKSVPAFAPLEPGSASSSRQIVSGMEGGGRQQMIVEKMVCNFSWSADHRVVDGATMARANELIREIVEEPAMMVMHLQ